MGEQTNAMESILVVTTAYYVAMFIEGRSGSGD
jgi:hypothetical protein